MTLKVRSSQSRQPIPKTSCDVPNSLSQPRALLSVTRIFTFTGRLLRGLVAVPFQALAFVGPWQVDAVPALSAHLGMVALVDV